MTGYSAPRYFVGRKSITEEPKSSGNFPLLHVIDNFFVGSRHLGEREWIIAVDTAGNLQAMPGETRNDLPESLRNELAFNELSRQRPARFIEATEIHHFNLEVVEQIGGASPGWNDPIYLYGTLYRLGNNKSETKGQLTVTRGDLLDALVAGYDYFFRYTAAAQDELSSCFHLMLPADVEDEIRRGAGIVLAYPLFPAELLATGSANEIIISQIIYDLLVNLREDFKRERIAHPLVSMELPVPNRFAVIQELKSQGYKVEGDNAIKQTPSTGGLKGFLSSIYGALTADELIVPREGTVDEFIALARDTLRPLEKDSSMNRAVAVRSCIKPLPANNYTVKTNTPPAELTRKNSMKTPAAPDYRLEQYQQISKSKSSDWMNDFISAHHTKDSVSKITSASELKPPVIAKSAAESKKEKQKEWQTDFSGFAENSASKAKDENDRAQAKSSPDWLKDFE